jgi:hypothetical protein
MVRPASASRWRQAIGSLQLGLYAVSRAGIRLGGLSPGAKRLSEPVGHQAAEISLNKRLYDQALALLARALLERGALASNGGQARALPQSNSWEASGGGGIGRGRHRKAAASGLSVRRISLAGPQAAARKKTNFRSSEKYSSPL